MNTEQYPGLARATLLIALDNGGINRGRSVEKQRRDVARFLAKRPSELLEPIDAWLSQQTDEQMETICCGEHTEVQAALAGAPPFTDDLLNEYFDEVC